MSFTVGLVITLLVLCFIGLSVVGSIFSGLFIVLGGYAYMAIASLWFDVPDSLNVGEKVVFWFAVFLIVTGFSLMSSKPVRRTKSGKKDKRFKEVEASKEDRSDGASLFIVALVVFGIRWLIEKFDIVAKVIAFFN